jgi:succinate dehydrogenase flavin-adding protein (antitoxin of CptAB toxin-antitoxin module)
MGLLNLPLGISIRPTAIGHWIALNPYSPLHIIKRLDTTLLFSEVKRVIKTIINEDTSRVRVYFKPKRGSRAFELTAIYENKLSTAYDVLDLEKKEILGRVLLCNDAMKKLLTEKQRLSSFRVFITHN